MPQGGRAGGAKGIVDAGQVGCGGGEFGASLRIRQRAAGGGASRGGPVCFVFSIIRCYIKEDVLTHLCSSSPVAVRATPINHVRVHVHTPRSRLDA